MTIAIHLKDKSSMNQERVEPLTSGQPQQPPKFPGRVFKSPSGTILCDECCNGDRCDDPRHRDRANCSYCKGTGIPIPADPTSGPQQEQPSPKCNKVVNDEGFVPDLCGLDKGHDGPCKWVFPKKLAAATGPASQSAEPLPCVTDHKFVANECHDHGCHFLFLQSVNKCGHCTPASGAAQGLAKEGEGVYSSSSRPRAIAPKELEVLTEQPAPVTPVGQRDLRKWCLERADGIEKQYGNCCGDMLNISAADLADELQEFGQFIIEKQAAPPVPHCPRCRSQEKNAEISKLYRL